MLPIRTILFFSLGIVLLILTLIKKKEKITLEDILSSFWSGGIFSAGIYAIYYTIILIIKLFTNNELPPFNEGDIIIFFVGGLSLLYIGIRNFRKLLNS